MTRSEHLDWCKKRALAYAAQGNRNDAKASFLSDMRKHPATKNHPTMTLMVELFGGGCLATAADMARFIEGFN